MTLLAATALLAGLTLSRTGHAEGVMPPAAPPDAAAREQDLATKKAKKFENVGKGLFWAGYGVDFIIATNMVLIPPLMSATGPGAENGQSHTCVGDVCGTNPWTVSRHFWPLYIPLAGPVWSLSYSDVRNQPSNVFYIGTTLAMQVAGAGLYVSGRAMEPRAPAPRGAISSFTVMPILEPKKQGLSAQASF